MTVACRSLHHRGQRQTVRAIPGAEPTASVAMRFLAENANH
jgi:hypothetical protein